ncbi:4Fe-4S dicluster domain-containing protein [Candidatus Bathyarchaeota archaeon]|nr:4Fe-4S dicluster domain-containing protein [Candidatus Bathyarchaeota archaeon]RJS89295.1 MAG: 4Fe-4S dicluster domain-containing protein [Candidatus Bathyarchaeota archaeon]
MKNLKMQKVLIYDPDKCTGCRYCEIACAYYHFKTFNFERAHLHVIFDEEKRAFEAIYCHHCDEPICAAACPSDAISKDEETGWVRINPSVCIGCKTCIVVCPLSAPWFNETFHVSMKCDFCNGEPQCARFCPPQAIRVVTREEALKFSEKRYLEAST